MGLKGQLEDLPLIDMLQIIAFSKKSGYLRVAGPAGRGAVVLEEGRVLFAFSWSTMSRIREMARDPDKISPEANRENIEAALRELAGLREGSFKFELTSSISDELGGVRIRPYMIPNGIDPQELLLDLAVEIDNERRQATTLLELAFQGDLPATDSEPIDDVEDIESDFIGEESAPSSAATPAASLPEAEVLEPPPPVEDPPASETVPVETVRAVPEPTTPERNLERLSVVIVDDEPPVIEVVGGALRSAGCRVYSATSPVAGADVVRARKKEGDHVLVVADLKMPTTSGRSFWGGFELIRWLERNGTVPPILLMVESLGEKARARAKALGIRRIVYKPTLTKPDPELYRNDLQDFAKTVHAQLRNLIEDTAPSDAVETTPPTNAKEPSTGPADVNQMDFLASMTKKLVEPGGSTDVSRLVLQVAAKFLERGVLFVVKSDNARGLAGFGFASDPSECANVARGIQLEIGKSGPATEVVRLSAPYRVTKDLNWFDNSLFESIGQGKASEAVLLPMLYNRATLLLLYGDNAITGKKLGDLGGLELFMAQAGMALENKLLQRKVGGDASAQENVGQTSPL